METIFGWKIIENEVVDTGCSPDLLKRIENSFQQNVCVWLSLVQVLVIFCFIMVKSHGFQVCLWFSTCFQKICKVFEF